MKITIGGREVKQIKDRYYDVFDNKLYMLLFYHDVAKGGFWPSLDDALHKVDNPYLYSIIDQLTPEFLNDEKYQFVLQYPSIDEYLIWRQTVNPLEATNDETNQSVDGYQGIHVINQTTFKGLAKSRGNSNQDCHLLDGNPDVGLWHYAIGANESQFNNQIPGPVFDDTGEVYLSHVALWVLNPSSIPFGAKTCNKQKHSHSYQMYLVGLLLRSS